MIETTILLIVVIVATITLDNLYSNNKGMKKMGIRVTNLELMSTTFKSMNEKKEETTYKRKKKKKYYKPKQSIKTT